jgi:Fur family peroxide stress response transcriptional regulator
MKAKIARLKRKGVAITIQRLAVLDFLESNNHHPTAEEIYRNLKKKYPTLSQATIYTSLQVLRKAGEIQELNILKEKTYFDPNPKPHHHFYCQKCKKIFDIEISCPVVEKGWVDGHKVKEVQAYFYGVCSHCLKKTEK